MRYLSWWKKEDVMNFGDAIAIMSYFYMLIIHSDFCKYQIILLT